MSRIEDAMQLLEQGQPVDWRRLSLLQALDMAVIGERFAAEAAQRERDLDDQLAELLEIGSEGQPVRSLPEVG